MDGEQMRTAIAEITRGKTWEQSRFTPKNKKKQGDVG